MSGWRWPLGFEVRVALRFLREGRFQSILIIVGVAAGVAVVAYISALVDGLQRNTLTKTLGAQAHISVQPRQERVLRALAPAPGTQVASDTQPRAQRLRSIDNWSAAAEVLARTPGVVAVSPMAAGAALAQRAEATRSVAVTGVEVELYDRIVNLREKLVAGPLRLQPGEAIIGTTLADDLGLRLGDRLTLTTGTRRSTLRVSALVDLGVRDLNRRSVIVPLREAQSLLDLAGGATQIDLRLADVWAAQAIADGLARQLPHDVESWQQSNAQLVSALNAQNVSTGLIRIVVLVVVVLGIASVLVVSVVQKQREIGILRAMGATRAQVLRIFLVQGALVGAVGAVAGVLLAAAMVAVFTHFVRGADGQPLFPITMPPSLALQVAAIALASGVLAAVMPARRAARMDPAQAIRL
jgi:lipoprotein-releasing system permease protein